MLKLKEIRQERGLSVAQLTKLSGVSLRTIQDMEARGDCRMSTAYVIAQALSVTLDALWEPDKDEAGE